MTTTLISHATPAAFAAHADSRNDYELIANQYFSSTKPNVLYGGAKYVTVDMAQSAGYKVVSDRASMLGMNTESTTYVAGQFDANHLPYGRDSIGSLPHLSKMTASALNILDNNPNGFFLMIEGGRIDHGSHSNQIEHAIGEVIEFANTVEQVINWSKGRSDTLIIVTADHETGGMKIFSSNGRGQYPTVSWSPDGHTGESVGIYAWGVGASSFKGVIDNTFINTVMIQSTLRSRVTSATR